MSWNSRRLHGAVFAGAIAQCVLVSTASAEPAPPFRELLAQTATTAPRLAEAQSRVAQAEGLARQAAARPNPSLSLGAENFAGSSPYTGISRTETTLSVQQPFELGGKRAARITSARAAIEAARAQATLSSAEFAFQLAQAYAQAEAAEQRVKLAADSLALAQEDARVAGILVQAGKEADVRRVQAEAAVQAARAGADQADAERVTAFARLTALSGSPVPFEAVSASLLAHADTVEAPRLDPLSGPAYAAALADREAAAQRIRVERTRARPDLIVQFGVRRLSGDDATAFVGGISGQIPLFDRNRGNISAAQAELAGAEARLNAARLDAQAEARSGTYRIQAAASRLSAARSGEAAAAEAYRLSRVGYESGKLPLIELLSARRNVTEARAQILSAQLERLDAEATLARLQGIAPFGDQP